MRRNSPCTCSWAQALCWSVLCQGNGCSSCSIHLPHSWCHQASWPPPLSCPQNGNNLTPAIQNLGPANPRVTQVPAALGLHPKCTLLRTCLRAINPALFWPPFPLTSSPHCSWNSLQPFPSMSSVAPCKVTTTWISPFPLSASLLLCEGSSQPP